MNRIIKIHLIGVLLLLVSQQAFCKKPKPVPVYSSESTMGEIYTPKPKSTPRINGPLVYGARPGNPFLYRIPCQGERPIRFHVSNLPEGLNLDSQNGIISGKTPQKGEYLIKIRASNSHGHDDRSFKLVSGELLALTPPMGWNHWYVHYNRINDAMMRHAADAMINSGMADVGYQYVNIDDCWMNASESGNYMKDSTRIGPTRDQNGALLGNIHFPDMKALADYIHSKGLKAGLYSSPGPNTCCGMEGSYTYEEKDAAQFAEWGYDFLKYDWCSYGRIAGKKPTLEQMKKPYELMGRALEKQKRDIVFNLCQYGMGEVWKWGREVGGHCWRTAGDLGFELDRFFNVALKNAQYGAYSKPGAWNDPDYIQIGYIGAQKGTTFTKASPCPLNPREQYSYMSLWSLMAAPLFFSGDMSLLDEFTLNVLCNPEVIAIDQDPLGKCGLVKTLGNDCFLMVKDLADGTKAVGIFNHGKQKTEVVASWKDLQIQGKKLVRDVWRQKDLGIYADQFIATIEPQGVVLIKIGKGN